MNTRGEKVGKNGKTAKKYAREAKTPLKVYVRQTVARGPKDEVIDRWVAAKAAHQPRKWHRAAVKKAKAEGRRAFNRKSSAARRAAKSKAAK